MPEVSNLPWNSPDTHVLLRNFPSFTIRIVPRYANRRTNRRPAWQWFTVTWMAHQKKILPVR